MFTPILAWYRKAALSVLWFGLLVCAPARAAFLSGEALDTAADVVAIIVLIVVPIVVIVVFWLVHVLPERLAEKRHHPQTAAIQTLCLLSLVFGGLLWPLAWLWAFTKPVAYRVAYGTDKADEWHLEMGEKARAGALLEDELAHLRAELDSMAARGALPANLRQLRADLLQLAATRATQTAAVLEAPPQRTPPLATPPAGPPPAAGGSA